MKFSFVSNDGKESKITGNSACWAGAYKVFNYIPTNGYHFLRTYFSSPSYTGYDYAYGKIKREDPTNILNVVSEIFPEEEFIKEWYNTFLPDPNKEYSDPYLDVPLEFNTNKAYMALAIARYAFDNPKFTALFNQRINKLKECKLPIKNFSFFLLANSGEYSWGEFAGSGHGVQSFRRQPKRDALENLRKYINSDIQYINDKYKINRKLCIGTQIFNKTLEHCCFSTGNWCPKTWIKEYKDLLITEDK